MMKNGSFTCRKYIVRENLQPMLAQITQADITDIFVGASGPLFTEHGLFVK